MISSELPEILHMSDRVYVMHEGRIVKELPREEADQETVLRYAMGAVWRVSDGAQSFFA